MWLYSHDKNSEHWNCASSREEAISEGFYDENIDVVYTSKGVLPPAPTVDRMWVDGILDLIDDHYANHTEEEVNWPAPVAMEKMMAELQKLIDEWEERYSMKPNWWQITEIEEISREEVSNEK